MKILTNSIHYLHMNYQLIIEIIKFQYYLYHLSLFEQFIRKYINKAIFILKYIKLYIK